MGSHHGGVEHLNQMRGLAHRRERIKEGFEDAGAAQSPEPFPDAVPVSEFFRKRPSRDVVNHEIVQGLEKPPPAARPRCVEQSQNNRPVLFRHDGEHGRSSKNRPPMSHRKTDLGIPIALYLAESVHTA